MSDSIGARLRDARLARGQEVGDVADVLKIRRSHVIAMESENFQALGAAPYARGHLRNYARHLGLDADELVGLWDDQHGSVSGGAHPISVSGNVANTEPREPLPRWLVVIGLVAVVLGALALIGQLGGRNPSAVPSEIAAPPTPAAPSTSAPQPTTSPGLTTPAPPTVEPTTTPPTPQGVDLLLAFESSVWMQITVDGQAHPQSQQTFNAGETLQLQGDQRIEIRYGNAGGALVELNGQDLGSPGAAGEVLDVVYEPDGATPS